MDLKELKKNALAQSSKAKALQEERDGIVRNIALNIRNNIENIITPYVEEMNQFVKDIEVASLVDFESSETVLELGEKVKQKGFCLYLNLSNDGVQFYFTGNGQGFFLASANYRLPDDEKLLYLSEWFLSEDKVQKLLDIINAKYSILLEAWGSALKEYNENLSKTITELTEQLKASSTIEDKDDGTVEIHLGGKTYKATLKEE